MTGSARASNYFDETSELANACRVESYAIGAEMKKVGLPDNLIVAAVTTANDFEGVFNLLKMWANESDPAERDAIVSDIQELIDDCAQPEKVEGVYVRFDDLDRIASDVRKFKDSLRALVDERGGIGKLAELTAIPQPSLSRFFNTAAMPRRTTLHKIARALNLSQIQIATEWSV
jgi:DNA-binding phage protein